MNDFQKYLTDVAIDAIRQEAGKIIANPRKQDEIGTLEIAESLDELEIAFRELTTDQRFKAACDHGRVDDFRGGSKFYRKPNKTASPAPAEQVIGTGDKKSEHQA